MHTQVTSAHPKVHLLPAQRLLLPLDWEFSLLSTQRFPSSHPAAQSIQTHLCRQLSAFFIQRWTGDFLCSLLDDSQVLNQTHLCRQLSVDLGSLQLSVPARLTRCDLIDKFSASGLKFSILARGAQARHMGLQFKYMPHAEKTHLPASSARRASYSASSSSAAALCARVI